MPRVVIAGVSTRAAAESAASAGFDVTAIDAFADVDQHASVRALSIPRPFSARAAARATRAVDCDAVAYLSNFENHPDDVRELAGGRELWGNPPAVIRLVRDPERLAHALRERKIPVPRVITRVGDEAPDDREWLVKPLASGGGHAVHRWVRGSRIPRACYLQELIEGTPGSVVFVAARGQTKPLGVTRQLVGDPAFGAANYRYCGNILAPDAGSGALVDGARIVAHAVVEEFGLVGVNGLDFVVRDGCPFAVEVNPRWTSSMELVERACGVSVFGAHAAACTSGTLPEFEFLAAQSARDAVGKAVVFAREDVTIGDTTGWLEDSSVRDVPRSGERIRTGRPVCTVFAAGRDDASCYAALVARSDRVYADLRGFR
jgi:predicted ATP-grasp superfamily ATP-dependent carboligase